MKTINKFIGEYSFLSNFYPVTVCFIPDSIPYDLYDRGNIIIGPSVEHVFQAAKTLIPK